MKIKFFCTCGASCTGTISPDAKAEKMLKLIREAHTGPGHAECDAKTAAKVRAKANRRGRTSRHKGSSVSM